MSDTVYVYGVLQAADAASLTTSGVMGSPVRAVQKGDLAALVSDVAGDALAAAREVRAHWRVLEAAAAQTTILPMRFGTVMESDEAVCLMLDEGAERLTALLADLHGRVQLNVRGSYAEDALLRGVVKSAPRIAALREHVQRLPEAAGYYERIQLGELIAAEVQRYRDAHTAHAYERLAPLAVAARQEAASAPDAAFHLAFLVERDRVDGFSAAVADLTKEFGDDVAIRYVGPLAPYSFADAELSIAGAA